MTAPQHPFLVQLARLTHLPETLGKRLDDMGGALRCTTCLRTMPMKGAAGYLRTGWPKCCGLTMEWVTRS